jgi:hypothetical protein
MDVDTAAISHQVFGARDRADESTSALPEGVIIQTPIYMGPAKMRERDRLSTLAVMAVHGRSNDISPRAWACWTFTYTLLCFPELRKSAEGYNGREYVFKPLDPKYIEACVAIIKAGEESEEDKSTGYGAVVEALVPPAGFPEINIGRATIPEDVAACITVPCVYGYLGLLAFLSGKAITPLNQTSITERRPQNLIDTYKIQPEAEFFLKGEGRMSEQAHTYIHLAWRMHDGMRKAFISAYARFDAGKSLPQKVVYSVTKLLEYSGMQPGFFIHEFLQARPAVVKYSCTRAALNAYITSVREVAQAPSYLQPYYKIFYGDSKRVFHRNVIMPLSVCAVAYKRLTSDSMRNFTLGEGATEFLNRFNAEAVLRKEAPISLTPSAKEADIPEE